MRHLDLFTGIGGFAFAAQVVWGDDYELVATCEMNEFCQKVIHKHWPGTPNHPDIKTMNGEKYAGTVELITGGFPCQPYSLTGKRKGADDDRALWPEMLRVIDECGRPTVVAENVAGILSMGFDLFCADLENLGYEVRALDLAAHALGLPTLERHIWIVATSKEKRRERDTIQQIPQLSRISSQLPGSYQRMPERWNLSEARTCRVGERIPNRVHRLEGIGNAINPQMAMAIFQALKESQTL